jgi:hypothetical protein
VTRTAALAAYFRERPGRWLDGREISVIAGFYAFRSRISDVRKQYGLTIENRQRRCVGANGRYTVSEYRYNPTQPTTPPRTLLFETVEAS